MVYLGHNHLLMHKGGNIMAGILFGYRSSPCFYEPFDFETEFKITAKGTLIFRIFNKPLKAEFKHKVNLPEQVALDLSEVLVNHQDRIKSFPTFIENTLVLDGVYQRFTFPGKKIETSNIGRLDAEMLKRIKDEQLGDEYHQALQRNALMEIVTEIYPILQPYGMKVSNWTHFECDWPPLKELAAFASNLISSEKTFPESFPKYRGS